MNNFHLMTTKQADEEMVYLEGINPLKPPKEFNYDRECFAKYCDMQANSMNLSTYYEAEKFCLDLATKARGRK